MNSTLKLFEKLLAEQGVERNTDEMDLAKSLAFYVLKHWKVESMLQGNPPLHFANLYEKNKMIVIANVTVVLEHMGNLIKTKKMEVPKA